MRISATCGAVLLVAAAIGAAHAQTAAPTAAGTAGQPVAVTSGLVREVQFMLQQVGIDPGPIDGVPSRLTNTALRRFEEKRNLPPTVLEIGRPAPDAVISVLRQEAAHTLLGTPAVPAAPAPVVAAPPAPTPAPDRFAACKFDPADFHVGGRDYTPESLLKEAFNGSTEHAVIELRKRLDEARQIAQQVGAAATKEVTRQSRVFDYYECRLKIEKETASK